MLVLLVGASSNVLAGSLHVQFPVRAHTWVASLIPSRGGNGRQPIDVSHIDVSLSLSLPLSKIDNKKYPWMITISNNSELHTELKY